MGRRLQSRLVGALSDAFPQAFGRLGARGFLRPRRHGAADYWPGSFDGFIRCSVLLDGLEVPYWTRGDGPAVLLVHGWERDHRAMGGFTKPLLSQGVRVVALDLPAHGEAGGREAPAPLMAQAVAAVAEAVPGVQGVIAHSVGGAMTVLAQEAYGLSLERRVLIAAPRGAKDYAFAQGRAQGLRERALRAMGSQIEQALGEPLERFRVNEALRRTQASTLLIHALDDAIVPPADGELNAAAANAQTVWRDSGGHNRILRDPAVVQAAAAFVIAGRDRAGCEAASGSLGREG